MFSSTHARRENPGCRRRGRHYKQTFGYDFPDILPRFPRVFETPLGHTGGGLLLDYPFTSVSAIIVMVSLEKLNNIN